MRDHRYVRHPTAASLVDEAKVPNRKRKLDAVRRHGMWAFVHIPDDGECIVHYWHRSDQDPRLIALMIGHELGHIADGGPKDDVIGDAAEEDRADEFGRAAQEALTCLAAMGLVTDSRGRPLDPRGPGPGGRSRRATAAGPTGRPSHTPAPRARRR